MALTVHYWTCSSCGYLLIKTKTSGDEGACPMPHDEPIPLTYGGTGSLF